MQVERTEESLLSKVSGGRVCNTRATYLLAGDSRPNGRVIPRTALEPHDFSVKVAARSHQERGSRPISLLVR